MTYTITCTFRGRLDQGKGADLLLEVLPQFLDNNTTHDWEFHIFGTGAYHNDFIAISTQYPQIILHGRATRDQIKPVAQSGHYCLYPSTCLETFGMTALEGCKLGLPVIAPSKGGLQQFIVEGCDILQNQGNHIQQLSQQLVYIDQQHDQKYNIRQSQTLQIASQFGPSQWLQNIAKLL